MIDFSSAMLRHLAVAFVGNKNRYEGVHIPKQTLTNVNDLAEELLFPAMIKTFATTEEYFRFTPQADTFFDGELDSPSQIWEDCDLIFADPDMFTNLAPRFARQLYEFMVDPKAGGREFFVAYFNDLLVDGEVVAGIGLWKVQSQDNFFKMEKSPEQYILNVIGGINPHDVVIAALILNMEASEGYRICAIDKVSKKTERSFWKDAFLRLQPIHDNYFNTRHYISLAHEFIAKKAPFQLGLNRKQTITMLDKASNYFKDNDEFEVDNFAETVFENEAQINSFDTYVFDYEKAYNTNLERSFEISSQAVKKEVGVLKNTLKLDHNFVVNVNGRPDLLDQGFDDEKGMAYFKLYYNNEG